MTSNRWRRTATELQVEVMWHLAEEGPAAASPEAVLAAVQALRSYLPKKRKLSIDAWRETPAGHRTALVEVLLSGARREAGAPRAVAFEAAAEALRAALP